MLYWFSLDKYKLKPMSCWLSCHGWLLPATCCTCLIVDLMFTEMLLQLALCGEDLTAYSALLVLELSITEIFPFSFTGICIWWEVQQRTHKRFLSRYDKNASSKTWCGEHKCFYTVHITLYGNLVLVGFKWLHAEDIYSVFLQVAYMDTRYEFHNNWDYDSNRKLTMQQSTLIIKYCSTVHVLWVHIRPSLQYQTLLTP